MARKLALIVAVALLTSPLLAHADDRTAKSNDDTLRARMAETKDQKSFRTLISNAAEVYSTVTKGAHGEVPQIVLNNARCIGVIPSVMTGALVVGGTHGEGLVSCKEKDNSWSQPATISLNQGSIGLQAGAKSAGLVLFFQTEESVQALKRGNFSLGSDLSVVAGSYDRGVDLGKAGVLVYSRSEGLFAGASVSGSKIGQSQNMLDRYYGEKVDYAALLEGRESPDNREETENLTRLFPK